MSTLSVGFLGLGMMGLPLAVKLAEAGIPVNSWSRRGTRKSHPPRFQAQKSPLDVGRASSRGVVFLCLPGLAEARQVLFGPRGLVSSISRPLTVVNIGTVSPSEARQLARRLNSRQVRYVEAPVLGGPKTASQGQGFFLVGGNRKNLREVSSLLLLMGPGYSYFGKIGTASATKLLGNLVTIGQTVLQGEALSLADRLGLDRKHVARALLQTGARSAIMERTLPKMLGHPAPPDFRLSHAYSSMSRLVVLSRSVNDLSALPTSILRVIEGFMAGGKGERDFSIVGEPSLRRSPGKTRFRVGLR